MSADPRQWAVNALDRACDSIRHGKFIVIIEDHSPVRVITETSETAPNRGKENTGGAAIPLRPRIR